MVSNARDGGIAWVTFNAIPSVNPTFKYQRLGPLALGSHARYCERHGYTFLPTLPTLPTTPAVADRPVCWGKIPALLDALESHRWVLWADSDALVLDDSRGLEAYCDPAYDLVVQSPEEWFEPVGVDRDAARRIMPINSGVFLIQSTDWAQGFLRRAWDRTSFVTRGEIWDGIGDQEAMISVLRDDPSALERIRHVDDLQCHPRSRHRGALIAHLYGNHAEHRIAPDACEEVLSRWEAAGRRGEPWPADMERFHWCAIQNKAPGSVPKRGGPELFLYRPDDLESEP